MITEAYLNGYMDKIAGLNQLKLLNRQSNFNKKLNTFNNRLGDTELVSSIKNITRYTNRKPVNNIVSKNKKLYWDITSGKKPYSVAADQYVATLPRFNNDLIRTQYKTEIDKELSLRHAIKVAKLNSKFKKDR